MERSRPRPSAMFEWLGWRVDDCQGRRVGALEAVYEDAAASPAWFLLRLGRFSSRYVLAPPADLMAWTGRFRLPYSRETIERAPLLFSAPPEVTPAMTAQLCRHYGIVASAAVHVVARRRVA